MRKVSKMFLSVLSVLLVAIIGTTMFVHAADKTDTMSFALRVKEETNEYVIVNVELEQGSFRNLDLQLQTNEKTISSCEYIIDGSDVEAYAKDLKKSGEQFMSAYNPKTQLGSMAMTKDLNKSNSIIAEAKFIKSTNSKVTNEDIILNILGCGSSTNNNDFTVNNYLPTPKTTTEKTSEVTKESTTKKTEEATTESRTSTTVQNVSTTKPESTAPTSNKENASETADTSNTTHTDIVTKTNNSNENASDIIDNPHTGDSASVITATVCLLAISLGAIVFFKKKEH